jgi:hypothetical protein
MPFPGFETLKTVKSRYATFFSSRRKYKTFVWFFRPILDQYACLNQKNQLYYVKNYFVTPEQVWSLWSQVPKNHIERVSSELQDWITFYKQFLQQFNISKTVACVLCNDLLYNLAYVTASYL